MRLRYVFLHYRIPATGGMTVDWVLEKNFPGGLGLLQPQTPQGDVGKRDVLRYLHTHPQTVALTGHHLRPPAPMRESLRVIELAFLRHPLDRLQAIYTAARSEDTLHLVSSVEAERRARELSLADWLRWLMDAEPQRAFNAQTAALGVPGTWAFPPAEADLARATETMRRLGVVGTTERFDESLVAAEHFLRRYFPTLNCSYVRFPSRDDHPADLDARLARMRDRCGASLYDDLRRCNALDEALWRAANTELDRRLGYIPDVESKVAELRARSTRAEQP